MRTTVLASLGVVVMLATGCASSDEADEEVSAGESNLEAPSASRVLTVEQAKAKVVGAGYFRDRADIQCGHDLTIRSGGNFKYGERACSEGATFEYWEGSWTVTDGGGRGPTLNLNPTGLTPAWSYQIEVVSGKVKLTRWFGWEVMTPNGD